MISRAGSGHNENQLAGWPCKPLNTSTITHQPFAFTGTSVRGKRAAVVVFSYYPSDTRVMRAAEALSRSGMDVDLLCIQQSPQEPRQERINGVDVFRVGLKKRRSGKLAYASQYLTFLFLSFIWLSRRRLSRRYELVHIHNMPDFLVFCASFAKALGARVVLDLHDPTPEIFISVFGLTSDHFLVKVLRWCERCSVRFADMILTPNISFRDLFVARGCPSRKIEIVMNTPLEEVFPLREPAEAASSDPARPFVLMYHGTLVERHGLHTAIEAVSQLRERIPGLRFNVYGEETGYLKEHIFPLVSQLGLKGRVEFFGEQPQAVIAQAVADCSLGVVPNLRTVFTEINFPTRIFEYLALGKPVIVPDTRGIRDYFDADEILFFKPGDVESLASQIQWVFDNPRKTSTLVRAGQVVYRRHLWKDEEWRMIALLSRLVK